MLTVLYQYIYLILVIFLTVFAMSKYNGMSNQRLENHNKANMGSLFVVVIFFILAIGFRPISSFFVDMANYNAEYYAFHYGSPFVFDWNAENYLFDNLFAWMGSLMMDIRLFFLLISIIYFGCAAIACIKIFPNDALLTFVVFLGALSTYSYGTNGIKAGAAASIFLLALAYRDSKVLSAFLLFVTLGCHHSMLAPIVAYVMATVYRKPHLYLCAWLGCLLLAAAHVTFFQTLFAGYTDEHGASYLAVDNPDKDVTGFRPDFVLYSAVPIFLGFYLMVKKRIKSDYFNFLWCVYTATNCVFLLCTYGSYINRIAYLSWLMYPIVLLYPFINISWSINQKKYLKQAVYYHLLFTVFMVFIYYVFFALHH